MNLTDFSLRNRTLIVVLTLGALYAGFQSFNSLPRLEDPEFTIKEALVITPYPGATPYEVEEEEDGPSKSVVSYRSGDFTKVLDVLRNESPVSFYWNEETGAALLRTGAEDVGEGEDEFDD